VNRNWYFLGLGRFVLAVLFVAFISACAGPERPKPVDLGPNVPLIGIKLAWAAHLGPVDFPLQMLAAGDSVFVAGSEGVVAQINATSGKDVWRVALGTQLTAGVGTDGRYSAVVSKANQLIVISEGREIWRQKLGALTLTAPLVAGDRVFVLSADRTVYAFDAASGRKLWQQQRNGDSLVLGQSGLLLAVGDALVIGQGGRLVGLNPLNGVLRWEAPIATSRGTNEVERLVDLVAGYSRDRSTVCVRAFQSAIGCVDVGQGRVLWTKPASGSTGVHGDESAIFATESDGRLVSSRRTDGERLWVSELLKYRSLTSPLLLGKSVVVGDNEGMLHFLSRQDGSPLNRIATDGSPVVSSPVLTGQTVIAVTKRGGIFGFRPE
jgi:outer membrane protein assembly factor BamB